MIGADKFQKQAKPGAGSASTNNANNGQGGNQSGNGRDQGPQPDRAWLAERASTIAAPAKPPVANSADAAPTNDTANNDGRATTAVELDAASPVAFVGEPLRVRGHLRAISGDADTKGRTLEVWLVDPKQPSASVRVGLVTTAAKGRFDGEIALPLDARLGVWDLVVRFAGDRHLQPAFSRER